MSSNLGKIWHRERQQGSKQPDQILIINEVSFSVFALKAVGTTR